MVNIWGFLLQTLSLSLTAALLLIVKRLLSDKLSPRWQYGVWVVLALRALIPVDPSAGALLPLPLWAETLKGLAERGLSSAYSEVYAPISLRHALPYIKEAPLSLTDWLFAVYLAGVTATLIWYLITYVKLRRLLKRGSPVSQAVSEKIKGVSERYSLPLCPAVSVKGLPSAFVCGFLRPVLALPEDGDADGRVILHELLHLKYRDALQCTLWCLLRALNWCNPFLHYVFDRVGNDMEALCDQRALERLEGEERREYGVILLDMANEKYARAPGTSSISNGGKNIARRVAAIARFKRYPQGMALVSMCIVLALAVSTLQAAEGSFDAELFRPKAAKELASAMAMARLNRCGTVAGALDTYAKGLLLENGLYLACASPLTKHADLEAQMRRNPESDGWAAYHVDSGRGLEYAESLLGYYIYNLRDDGAGGFEALLILPVSDYIYDDGSYLYEHESGVIYPERALLIPVRVRHEDGWVVEEAGERTLSGENYDNLYYSDAETPHIRRLSRKCASGTLTVTSDVRYYVDIFADSGGFWGGEYFDPAPRPDAQFEYARIHTRVEYSAEGNEWDSLPERSMTYHLIPLSSPDETPEFPSVSIYGNTGGSSSDGSVWDNHAIGENGEYYVSGGGGYQVDCGDRPAELPPACAVRLYWDGKVVEEVIIGEEDAA